MVEPSLPKSRLNQIAKRKLSELGIPTALGRDGETLEAELAVTHGRLANPFTREPINRARFRVEGHDRARFLEPPLLAEMTPLSFFHHQTLVDLLGAIGDGLRRRELGITRGAERLRNLGAEVRIDPVRGVLRARVVLHSSLGAMILEVTERGVHAIELQRHNRARGAAPSSLLLQPIPIDLTRIGSATELVMLLGNLASEIYTRAQRAAASGGNLATGLTADLELVLSSDDLVGSTPKIAVEHTLGSADVIRIMTGDLQPSYSLPPPDPDPRVPTLGALAEAFGSEARLDPRAIISRDFELEGLRIHFEAKQLDGLRFAGKLSAGERVLWKEEIELDQFPGVDQLAASVLGTLDVPALPENGRD